MPILRHNTPGHSLLLMPVRLGNESWPKNKVRILSCDVDGNLFTQFIGRSVYRRIQEKARQRLSSLVSYATVYWDNGSRLTPLLVEIGQKENWALEHILEHAFRRGIIPDLLRGYPSEIIRLAEEQVWQETAGAAAGREKSAAGLPSRELGRLPYYSKGDMELSIPIYKAARAFPLIVLRALFPMENTPPGQQNLLVMDSDGDVLTAAMPVKAVQKANRKLAALEKQGKQGRLMCFRDATVDVLELSAVQSKALDNLMRRFEDTGEKQALPVTVRQVLNTAKEKP